MKTILFRYRSLLPFLFLPAVFLALYLVTRSNLYQEHNSILPRAVALDLMISIPVLYFLVVRKTSIPVLTVVPVFLLSMFIGTKIGTGADGWFASVNHYRFFIAEAIFVMLETMMVIQVRRAYKKIKRGYAYFREDLFTACFSYFKREKMAHLVSTEITMFYYLFSRYQPEPSPHAFSYHKKSGKVLTIFFIALLLAESAGMHLLVQQWNAVAAWVLTISSLYIALILVAHYRASVRLPLVVTPNGLLLRNGLLYSTFVPYTSIAGIRETAYSSALKNKKPLYINSMAALGSVNLVIDLNREMETRGMYGSTKRFDALALELDDKKTFLQQVRAYFPAQ